MCYTLLCFTLLLLVSSSFCAKQKCCPDKECYELGDPWQTLTRLVPEPECEGNLTRFFLIESSNKDNPVVFTARNASKIPGYLNVRKPTIIFFHGWMSSAAAPSIMNITTLYSSRVNANGIFVDYGEIAKNVNYPQVVSNLRVVATYVTKMVQNIIQAGVSPSQIHLIGHSLGAHLAAYVAKAIPGIGRLTGLDPAGPWFTDKNCEVRLCKGDAQFTEAIHTNGNPVTGLGTSDEDADVDFWVNGGWEQPGCGLEVVPRQLLDLHHDNTSDAILACSHSRSLLYYAEALASSCKFWGVKAGLVNKLTSRLTLGYASKVVVNPDTCTLQNCVPIGLDTINATGRGNFVVPTNSQPPFCESK
ncbi:phospholipase A1-like [Cryptotermes secundus]|uniref:phospholipase A1-like n=1 Tax=Cryptotermes secundus TaxID=105785 RepID=UPI000CD7B6E8|nr:phospholipase A1-like [Cryptotermes secundus]